MHRCALYDDHDPVPRGGFHLFNCGATEAQWLYIRKLEGSPGQQYMTICEVVLEGHRITADGKVFTIAILSTVGAYIYLFIDLCIYKMVHTYVFVYVCVCVCVCAFVFMIHTPINKCSDMANPLL